LDKLCLFETKVNATPIEECSSRKLMKVESATTDQKAENSNCYHQGTKDFLDSSGNVSARLSCQAGLRNGPSEFERKKTGTLFDIDSQEIDNKNGIAHGKVRRKHYSNRYKVEYSVQDGVLSGLTIPLNKNDRWSRNKEAPDSYKDGVFEDQLISGQSNAGKFRNGIPIGYPNYMKRGCMSSSSAILQVDLPMATQSRNAN
jgi:hypothetical protein